MSQQFTGSMRGTVSDAQGIIPGVTVTLTNEGTTVARETISNNVGEYTFPAGTPGTYSVRTSLPGYKTYEQRGISVGTATALTIDLVLEVGTVEEEITVTADAPLIETSTASVGDTLDREILETLPAPGPQRLFGCSHNPDGYPDRRPAVQPPAGPVERLAYFARWRRYS